MDYWNRLAREIDDIPDPFRERLMSLIEKWLGSNSNGATGPEIELEKKLGQLNRRQLRIVNKAQRAFTPRAKANHR